ncbi:MAG: hypothetical protein NZM35_00405 [Chitinophagales bacterium]|nr:hypothetical protein [Chitinophagales bacterium]MDW8417778.1 hypothetical protein [Chitinophagales bacterium]
MKNIKTLLGILAIVLLLFGMVWYFSSSTELDERFTLRKNDKIPYGTYVLYNSLSDLFPGAKITVNDKPATDIPLDSAKRIVYISICKRFRNASGDLTHILHLANEGHDVFLCATEMDAELTDALNIEMSSTDLPIVQNYNTTDSGTVSLSNKYFPEEVYTYPGRFAASSITTYEISSTEPLGYNQNNICNFIRLKTQGGNVFVHTQPYCFTNYFLMHRNNLSYAEKVFSLMDKKYDEVIWDEYHLTEPYLTYNSAGNSPFRILMEVPAFRYAIYVFLALVALYTFIYIKRQQRVVPVIQSPKNDSLDYVPTIGKLYYEQGNHLNLAHKMVTYFLEHVRQRFRLSTSALDDVFAHKLAARSGMNVNDALSLVKFTAHIKSARQFSAEELKDYHSQLEKYYQLTQ